MTRIARHPFRLVNATAPLLIAGLMTSTAAGCNEKSSTTKQVQPAADGTKAKPSVAYSRERLVQRAVQVTLMAAELAPYWHADQPGRKPLRVLANDIIPAESKFKMFGVNAVVGPADKLGGPAHVEVTQTEINVDAEETVTARVDLKLPVEGVSARAVVVGYGNNWRVERVTVTEN